MTLGNMGHATHLAIGMDTCKISQYLQHINSLKSEIASWPARGNSRFSVLCTSTPWFDTPKQFCLRHSDQRALKQIGFFLSTVFLDIIIVHSTGSLQDHALYLLLTIWITMIDCCFVAFPSSLLVLPLESIEAKNPMQ